jgi:HEAT repeat protein
MGIPSGLTRTKLVKRLEEERDPELLAQFTTHPAWQVRWAAIESLGKSDSLAAESYLLDVLATSSDAYDLTNASAALGRVGSATAIPTLTRLIHHRVDDVKSSAIHALGVLGDKSLTPVYLDALSDRSWTAKWSAMQAIQRNGDRRAISPVVDRLRQVLDRERRTQIGGWSEVMYALDFLRRWPTDDSARTTIDWVRSERLHRLQPDERAWFEATFGEGST